MWTVRPILSYYRTKLNSVYFPQVTMNQPTFHWVMTWMRKSKPSHTNPSKTLRESNIQDRWQLDIPVVNQKSVRSSFISSQQLTETQAERDAGSVRDHDDIVFVRLAKNHGTFT